MGNFPERADWAGRLAMTVALPDLLLSRRHALVNVKNREEEGQQHPNHENHDDQSANEPRETLARVRCSQAEPKKRDRDEDRRREEPEIPLAVGPAGGDQERRD